MAARRRRLLGGIGMKGIQRGRLMNSRYRQVGQSFQDMQISGMKERLAFFKHSLEEFAQNHKREINRNPEFRHHFSKMCNRIGVDPLASSKGFWAELLGVGDFYYELGVQLAQICYVRRNSTGGLMEMGELVALLQAKRSRTNPGVSVSKEDVIQAVKKLEILGNGYKVIRLNDRQYVQSVPMELSADHTAVLDKVESLRRGISTEELQRMLGWRSAERTSSAISALLKEGIAWVDEQTESGVPEYWFPGIILQGQEE